MPLTATITWEDPASANYRACELCEHGKTVGERGRYCTHPEAPRLLDAGVASCRASGGFCGPEAKHLTFPGLHPLQPFARVTP